MFVRLQVEQDAELKKEVQQYMNSEVHDILYYGDCAVFSLNAAHAFSSIFDASSQMRFVLCIFHSIVRFGLAVN